MLKLGEIKHIDINKKEVRVLAYGVYDDSLSPKHYPIAILTSPIPLLDEIGFYAKLTVGQQVLLDFIQNDDNQPVIVSYIASKKDINNVIFQKNIMEISTNKSKGIRLIEDGDNIKMQLDGEVDISLSTTGYKNLLDHINDIKSKIDYLVDEHNNFVGTYNTHLHIVTTAVVLNIPSNSGVGTGTAVQTVAQSSLAHKIGGYSDEFKKK